MSEIRVKSTGTIKLFESDNTSHVTIASPASLSANRTITIPDADVTLGAGTTINNNADNRVITGSGTANTLEGESTLTYDGTNLDLSDDKKIRLGNGNDTEIYHDSTSGHTFIRETGSGSLVLRTNNFVLQNAAGNANIINAPEGASGTDFSYNGSVKLSVENSGINVTGKIGNADGIQLGGSGTANLLDDYEEGTWTATMSVDGGAMSLNSSFNTGSYVKIGNIVNVQGFFEVDATNASGGFVNVAGLPFASASMSEGAEYSVGSVFVRKTSSAVGGGIVGWIEAGGQTQFAMRENGTTAGGNTLTGHFDSDTDFTINVTYRTA